MADQRQLRRGSDTTDLSLDDELAGDLDFDVAPRSAEQFFAQVRESGVLPAETARELQTQLAGLALHVGVARALACHLQRLLQGVLEPAGPERAPSGAKVLAATAGLHAAFARACGVLSR